MTEQVTVLYVGGAWQKRKRGFGSNVGPDPGFVNVGELWQVWYRGLRENERCGCGQPFYSCEFRRAVGEEAFGGWDNVDVYKMVAFIPYLKGQRYTPHYTLTAKAGTRSGKMNTLLEECGPILERLYQAIQRVSGAGVIVGSSKRLSYAVLPSLLPFADLHVVHLLRHSRAVAYSWARSKESSAVVGDRLMSRLSSSQASRAWSLQNCLYGFLPGFARLSRLRYEDFVNHPTSCLAETLIRVGFVVEAGSLPTVRGREISLSVDQTVSGNPARFRLGTIGLQPDEEWKAKMRGADKNVVTTLTTPLLLKYGYLGIKKMAKRIRY